HDLAVTEQLDIPELAEEVSQIDAFWVADVTLRNNGPDMTLGDLTDGLGVSDGADASLNSVWVAADEDADVEDPLEESLATGEEFSGLLVGEVYRGESYHLTFRSTPD